MDLAFVRNLHDDIRQWDSLVERRWWNTWKWGWADHARVYSLSYADAAVEPVSESCYDSPADEAQTLCRRVCAEVEGDDRVQGQCCGLGDAIAIFSRSVKFVIEADFLSLSLK